MRKQSDRLCLLPFDPKAHIMIHEFPFIQILYFSLSKQAILHMQIMLKPVPGDNQYRTVAIKFLAQGHNRSLWMEFKLKSGRHPLILSRIMPPTFIMSLGLQFCIVDIIIISHTKGKMFMYHYTDINKYTHMISIEALQQFSCSLI